MGQRMRNLRRLFGRRYLKRLVIVTVILGLAVGGVQLVRYARTALQSAFSPGSRSRGPAFHTDTATVERGSVTKAIIAYGQVKPMRTETLAFRKAKERIVSLRAEPGLPVVEGQVLVELDIAALERNLAEARGELQEAEGELDELAATDSARELELQVELSEAQTALEAAVGDLKAFDEGKNTPEARRKLAASELASAEAELRDLTDDPSHQKEIQRLEWLYNQAEVEHGPYVLIENPSEQDRDTEWLLRNEMLARRQTLEVARLDHQAGIRAAEQRVAEARRALERLDREIALGAHEIERAKLASAKDAAQAELMGIEEKLALPAEESDAVELARARAEVLKLEGEVQDATAALAEGRLRAPFDGVVLAVQAMPETLAVPGRDVVSVADTSAFRILAKFSELDVLDLREGMEALLTFDALGPDVRLTGRLGEIPRYGKYENGVTYYEVMVDFDGGEVTLRDGFSANVSVPVGSKENVLVIPAAAVWEEPGGSSVIVLTEGEREVRRIKTGVGDGVTVEVVDGLQEGEVVEVQLRGPLPGSVYMGGVRY